ncbi:class I glutamine amidotransferase-like protein [Dipodascopsis uninucleata]
MTKVETVIGVLALQGAFLEHKSHLQKAIRSARPGSRLADRDFKVIEVRTPEQLHLCDGLIIPGGESTSISLIAERGGLLEPLRNFVRVDCKPVWGTCAGMILLADEASRAKKGGQELIGGLHVRCQRNHFGRQVESFTCAIDMPFLSSYNGIDDPFTAVFIRAPIVDKILTDGQPEKELDELALVRAPELCSDNTKSSKVEIVACIPKDDKYNGEVVAVRQGHILGTSFHPELTPDYRLHEWWLEEFVVRR